MSTKPTKILIEFESKQFELEEPFPQTYDDFINKCKSTFNIKLSESESLNFKYKDDENDYIEISQETDYSEALNFAKTNFIKVIISIQDILASTTSNFQKMTSEQLNPLYRGQIFDENDFEEINTQSKKKILSSKERESFNKVFYLFRKKILLHHLSKFKPLLSKRSSQNESEERKARHNRIMEQIQSKVRTDLIQSKVVKSKMPFSQEANDNKSSNNNIRDINSFQNELKEQIQLPEYNRELGDEIYNKTLENFQIESNNEIKEKMTTLIENQFNVIKNEILEKTLQQSQIVINNFMDNIIKQEETRQSIFQQELNKLSQSKLSLSKCSNTIHTNIKCNYCNMFPIKGIRYKCTECDNYNLCEACEELNIDKCFHSKHHDFVILRFEKEQKRESVFSYKCLNQELVFHIYKNSNDSDEVIIKLLNDCENEWTSAKLVCDKSKSNLFCNDVNLPSLKPGKECEVSLIFKNYGNVPETDKKVVMMFYVNGKRYGKEMEMKVIVESAKNYDLKILEEFRKQFDLSKELFPDKQLLDALQKNKYKQNDAFQSLFQQ